MASADDYLSILQPSEEDRKAAMQRALMMAAAQAFAANDGRPFSSILGQTMFSGLKGYDDSVQSSRVARQDQFRSRKEAFDLAQQDKALKDREDIAKAMQAAQGATPQSGGMQPPQISPGGAVGPAQAPQMPDMRAQRRQMLQNTIDGLIQKGRGDLVGPLQDQLLKLQPELKETKTLMQNGKRVTVNFFKDGTSEVVPFAPDQEKLHFADTGSSVQGLDPLTGQPIGGAVKKTMTPGEMDASRRGNASLAQNAFDIKEGPDGALFYVPKTPGAQATPVQGPNGTLAGPKNLTETQGNAVAFGMRAKVANDILNDLETSGVDLGAPSQLLAKNRFTNPVASEAAQKAQQAKLNFMSATLRKESGAAISPSEYDAEDRKYFPQVGDSPGVREQKRQMRDLAIETLRAQAGPQGARNIGASAAPAAPVAKAAPKAGSMEDGYVFRGGNPADPKNWSKVGYGAGAP